MVNEELEDWSTADSSSHQQRTASTDPNANAAADQDPPSDSLLLGSAIVVPQDSDDVMLGQDDTQQHT